MSTNLTYHTFLAYIAPGAIFLFSFAEFLKREHQITMSINDLGALGLFLVISTIIGFINDNFGHILWDSFLLKSWWKDSKKIHYFGEYPSGNQSIRLEPIRIDYKSETDGMVLNRYILKRYGAELNQIIEQHSNLTPTEQEELRDKLKEEIVDAIFATKATPHVYARRQWAYSFYEASRNVLNLFPIYWLGLNLSYGQRYDPSFFWYTCVFFLILYYGILSYIKQLIRRIRRYHRDYVLGTMISWDEENTQGIRLAHTFRLRE